MAMKEKIVVLGTKKFNTELTQEQAKAMIPPETAIWRGLTRSE